MKKVLLPYMQKGYGIRTTLMGMRQMKDWAMFKRLLKQYKTFSFVRNPYDRIVSFYEFTKGVYKRHGDPWPYKDLKDYVFSQKDYWQFNQCNWLVNKADAIRIDFIGKFENLPEDWHKACDMVNVPRLELPHINASKRKPYREYYDYELKTAVTDIVKRDLEVFEYEF